MNELEQAALAMQSTADLYRLIRKIAQVVDKLEDRITALEAKRGPGRPAKDT